MPGIDAGRYGPPRSLLDDAFFSGPDGELGSLVAPHSGFVDDPQLATQNLADAAARLGARFLFHRTVVGVPPADTSSSAPAAPGSGSTIPTRATLARRPPGSRPR
ncbi:FAD-dependent oxidoreductase [Streptomyces sp. NPDC002740]